MIGKHLKTISAAMLFVGCTQLATAEQYSGINRVTFNDETHSKDFVGNGFLIEYQGKAYAVTVKHSLLEARTADMNSVSIDEHVHRWQIHPNGKPEQSVVLGKLLNQSVDEPLDMAILQKDWLVFDIEENNSDLSIMTLRNSPLVSGEKLTAYGCSYANQQRCEQDLYVGQFIKMDGANLRVSIDGLNPAALRGLSGSPVLDANGQVVGIVSNLLPSESGSGVDFAPANLDYLREVLRAL